MIYLGRLAEAHIIIECYAPPLTGPLPSFPIPLKSLSALRTQRHVPRRHIPLNKPIFLNVNCKHKIALKLHKNRRRPYLKTHVKLLLRPLPTSNRTRTVIPFAPHRAMLPSLIPPLRIRPAILRLSKCSAARHASQSLYNNHSPTNYEYSIPLQPKPSA